jgi:hypothetical protein
MPAYINLGGFLERSGAADQAVELWRNAANRSVPVTGNSVSYVTTALKQIARVLSDHHKTESAGKPPFSFVSMSIPTSTISSSNMWLCGSPAANGR